MFSCIGRKHLQHFFSRKKLHTAHIPHPYELISVWISLRPIFWSWGCCFGHSGVKPLPRLGTFGTESGDIMFCWPWWVHEEAPPRPSRQASGKAEADENPPKTGSKGMPRGILLFHGKSWRARKMSQHRDSQDSWWSRLIAGGYAREFGA